MEELDWGSIAVRLRELRLENKITIERLAEMVGVSTSFIGLVEKGDSGISIENLYKLSQVFRVSVDYILTGKADREYNYYSKFDQLNTALFDYSDEELNFLISLSKFLKPRISIKNKL